MEAVLAGQNFEDADAFAKAFNKERRNHGKAWITYVGQVAGKSVRIKTYGTGYLQIMEVDGIKHAPPMEMNVARWNEFIINAIKGKQS